MVLRWSIFIQAISITFLLHCCLMTLGQDAVGTQVTELTELDIQKGCYNFSVGNPAKKEFYSPNYPKYYPNETKCTLRLSAGYGQFIKLDFLDQFYLEESATCEYDYLEVRDGPYGYSELLGRYCGHSFPPSIASSDRYLWLKFVSDKSIEYSGFRAFYTYINVSGNYRPPFDDCVFHRSGHEGTIQRFDIDTRVYNYSKTWGVPVDCTWVIHVDPGWLMYITFPVFKLKFPNNCQLNYLDIFPESRSAEHILAHFCGTTAEPTKTSGNIAHVRYFSHHSAFLETEFEIYFTAFRDISSAGSEPCQPETEFDCGDSTCIDKSLKCNGRHNCKYRYDEEPSMCIQASVAGIMLTSEHMIIILIVFFCLVLGMCASISVSCYNKIKERREREREYRERRSKEASVAGGLDMNVAERGLEATLASQAAEIGARRKASKWSEENDDDGGCYVPEVDLSVFRKQPNGGEMIPRADDNRSPPPPPPQKPAPVGKASVATTVLDQPRKQPPYLSDRRDIVRGAVGGTAAGQSQAPPPLPPHLKDRSLETEADRGPPPPRGGPGPPRREGRPERPGAGREGPPPPYNDNQYVKNNRANTYRTYMTGQNPQDTSEGGNPHQFRAEAVIESSPRETARQSLESTQSAPDVIVQH